MSKIEQPCKVVDITEWRSIAKYASEAKVERRAGNHFENSEQKRLLEFAIHCPKEGLPSMHNEFRNDAHSPTFFF